MSSDLPTMDDMIDPDKNVQPSTTDSNPKESPKKSQSDKTKEKEKSDKKTTKKKTVKKKKEEKKEEHKKPQKIEEKKVEKEEEPKKEEPKKEDSKEEEPKVEDKKEETKKEEPKVEEEPKKEEKWPREPQEPKPKINTDFTPLIKEINDMKKEGNDKYKNKEIEEALAKYNEAYEKLKNELPKIDKERDHNPQTSELFTLYIQLAQNLSLCYFKLEKYEESIKLDQIVIARDSHYDKAYYRLFKSFLKLGDKAQAVFFGNILLNFDDETKKRYEDIIPEIEQAKKSLEEEYAAIRAQQRKEMMKSIAKYAVPIIVLIGAFAIYFFMFRKKKIAN